jgi:hypothetical protein
MMRVCGFGNGTSLVGEVRVTRNTARGRVFWNVVCSEITRFFRPLHRQPEATRYDLAPSSRPNRMSDTPISPDHDRSATQVRFLNREAAEVYLLLDFLSGRADRSLRPSPHEQASALLQQRLNAASVETHVRGSRRCRYRFLLRRMGKGVAGYTGRGTARRYRRPATAGGPDVGQSSVGSDEGATRPGIAAGLRKTLPELCRRHRDM